MKNKFSKLYFAVLTFFVIALFACTNFKYAKTNRFYKARAKELVAILKSNPGFQTVDSLAKAAQWVGTTNFDLRKPNFVIM